MDEFLEGFIGEVKDLLFQLENSLMDLEKDPQNTGIINSIFRVMHTLKGSAGMVGYKNIQDLTHEFESIYAELRDGHISVNNDIIDMTLKAKDQILNMIKSPGQVPVDADFIKQVRSRNFAHAAESHPEPVSVESCYLIVFKPDKDVFERGVNPDKTIEEVKSHGNWHEIMHEKKGSWQKQKDQKVCHTTWEIFLKTFLTKTELEDLFLFYEAEEFKVFSIGVKGETETELLTTLNNIYKGKIDPDNHINEGLSKLGKLSKPLPPKKEKEEVVTEVPVESSRETDGTVNVSSHKLDELMNLVSELVTITADIQAQASAYNDLRLNNALENIEKLTKKFRNNALDLRLVPVGTLLSRFRRQVRDLSKDLGKKVNLLIEGQDIEIDKTILRSIESPLQHIIRNSIDHGIEDEPERLQKSKTPEGLLKISAFYSGASVIIQVQDDGRGINLERVRECAIQKGYLQPDQNVTKQELLSFIMEPGFTTSENISIVSGRGVGMDVVRKELNSVGGSLEIFTEQDLGTSIVMKLPTTLTIIDTLLVNVDRTQVLIPVMDIEYCFKESNEKLFMKDNRYVEFKNNPIPLISLRKQFKYGPAEEKDLMVIVINKFDRRYAVTVDEIIGEHQAVIKPLGELFVNQPFFSGGSIMADGKLAFILDTNFLFNHITKI